MNGTTEFGRGRRTTYLDRTWLDHWTVLMLAPIKVPTLDELRSRMLEFMSENPRHPLACTLEDGGRRWRPVARRDRERHVDEVIVAGESFDIENPFDHLDQQRPDDRSNAPYKVIVGPGSMLFYFSHACGDAGVFSPFAVLMSLGDVHGLTTLLADAGLPVTTKMLFKEFRPHWREWWQHLRQPAHVTAPPSAAMQDSMSARESKTTARGALVSSAEFDAFKTWRKATCPELATTALMASATFVALEREGIQLNDKGFYTLVDLRRHLPKNQAFRPGNLAKSAYISVDMHDPAAIGSGVKELVSSARAVPATVVGAVSAALARPARRPETGVLEPLTMTFNSMMRIPGIEHFPWVDPRDAHFITMSYHVGVNGISISACAVEGGMSFTASFDPTRIEADAVSRALAQLRDIPAVLEARSPAANLKLVDQ